MVIIMIIITLIIVIIMTIMIIIIKMSNFRDKNISKKVKTNVDDDLTSKMFGFTF